MTAVPKRKLTAAEYLEIERKAEFKSEFYDGEMFAMSGGTYRHSRVKTKLIATLDRRLSGKRCRPTDSDMRVKVSDTGLYTYPDASVVCGKPVFDDLQTDVLLNPTAIFEVLSESTASYDRGKKFWHYRHIASLQDYVLVAQDEPVIEHYSRQANGGWLLQTVEGHSGVLILPSIECELPLAEIYADIDPPTE
jgi:Uma2 family endonuclease